MKQLNGNWFLIESSADLYHVGGFFENCYASHCHYHDDVDNGSIKVLVYQTDGKPQLFVAMIDKIVLDIGGKLNAPPSKKQIPIVLDFLNSDEVTQVWDIDCRIIQSGIVRINDVWMDVRNIPSGTVINHSLNLNNAHNVHAVPAGIIINGNLKICKTQIESIPEDVIVAGKIDKRYTYIKEN